MKVLCIYNKYDNSNTEALREIENELAVYVKNIEFTEWNEILSGLIPIHALPAVIFIREDLQGASIFDEKEGSTRLTLEAAKMLEEEESNLQNYETKRLDFLLNEKIKKANKTIGVELIQSKLLIRKLELERSKLQV